MSVFGTIVGLSIDIAALTMDVHLPTNKTIILVYNTRVAAAHAHALPRLRAEAIFASTTAPLHAVSLLQTRMQGFV
jgi:hypothetical protein